MTTATNPSTAPTMTALPLRAIRVSPDNPRRRIDEAALAELAASIREQGVLEPILVRPVAEGRDGSEYEVMAGERRYRAAKLAELSSIPAIIRQASDEEALQIAVVENLQRQDLDPIDEADGFKKLLSEQRCTVDALAAKVGKSAAYVRGRVKLAELPKTAKEALRSGKLPLSVALLVARIPNAKQQAEAGSAVMAGPMGEPMSFKAAAQYIQTHFMLSLADASFPTNDRALVPAAGACSTCPKRTGNDRALFAEVARGDLCTDAACFAAKKEAHWQRLQAEARQGAVAILPEKDAKAVFRYGRLDWEGEYYDLDADCLDDSKGRTWAKLLGKLAPKHVIARNPHDGAVHRLVLRSDAAAALKKAGHRSLIEPSRNAESAQRDAAAAKRQELARRQRLEVLRRTASAVVAAVIGKAEAKEPAAAFWRLLLDGIADGSWHEVVNTVCKRRGWSEKKVRAEEALAGHVSQLEAAKLRALVLEVVITRSAYSTWGTLALGKRLLEAAKLYGVDAKKIEAAVKAEIAASNGKAKKGSSS